MSPRTRRSAITTSPKPRFPSDTSREALRAQFAVLRGIPATRRLALMDDLTRLVQSMAREGLKRRNPERTEEEIDVLYSELVLGPELAARVREHRRKSLAPPAS